MTARVHPLAASDARSSDPLLDELVSFVGYRPNALLTMARKHGLLNAVLTLVQVTIRAEGLLPAELRYLVACEASRGAGCVYSATHAVHAAHHAGAAWEKLAALERFEHSERFTPRERAALAIARAGATLPVAPADDAFLSAARVFSDEEILEVVSIVALFGWFNRWNSLLGSELEDVPAEALQFVPWLSAMPRAAG